MKKTIFDEIQFVLLDFRSEWLHFNGIWLYFNGIYIYIYILINVGLGHLAWDMIWAHGPGPRDRGR